MKPQTLEALLTRASELSNKSLGELSECEGLSLQENFVHHKGWLGDFFETILGASAGNTAEPDFPNLGVELKTIPLNAHYRPMESTFVCAVSYPLEASWECSVVKKKLTRVLWVPVLEAPAISDRRVLPPFLWQPNEHQETMLREDWEELSTMLTLGQAAELTARYGTVLQMRPKAANARVLRTALNSEGELMAHVPGGFYLRANFTEEIMLSFLPL